MASIRLSLYITLISSSFALNRFTLSDVSEIRKGLRVK